MGWRGVRAGSALIVTSALVGATVAGGPGAGATQPAGTWGPESGPPPYVDAPVQRNGVSAAASPDGSRLVAVWNAEGQAGHRWVSAVATVAGGVATWGPVTVIAPDADAETSQVAISADGSTALAVATVWASGATQLWSATADLTGTTVRWGPPVRVSATVSDRWADQQRVRIALSPSGERALAMWVTRAGLLSAAGTVRGESIGWGRPARVVRGDAFPSLAMRASADGSRATAVWIRRLPRASKDARRVFTAESASAVVGAAPRWGAVSTLSSPSREGRAGEYRDEAPSADLALSDDGRRAVAAWSSLRRLRYVVQAAAATVDGRSADWPAPDRAPVLSARPPAEPTLTVPRPRWANNPLVGASSDGRRATVAWLDFWANDIDERGEYIRSVSGVARHRTMTWSDTLATVSATSRSRRVLSFWSDSLLAVCPDGSAATVVWTELTGQGGDSWWSLRASTAGVAGTQAQWSPLGRGQYLSAPRFDVGGATVSMSADCGTATAVWAGETSPTADPSVPVVWSRTWTR